MKPHLYFKNPQEGLAEYKQRPGGGKKMEMPQECGMEVTTLRNRDKNNIVQIAIYFKCNVNNYIKFVYY
jgi:hypothetical protein